MKFWSDSLYKKCMIILLLKNKKKTCYTTYYVIKAAYCNQKQIGIHNENEALYLQMYQYKMLASQCMYNTLCDLSNILKEYSLGSSIFFLSLIPC